MRLRNFLLCIPCILCSGRCNVLHAHAHQVSLKEDLDATSNLVNLPLPQRPDSEAPLQYNAAWLSDFRRAHTQIPSSMLSGDAFTRFYTRVYRVLGKGILPIHQELIDVQAQVAATHCPLLGYSCRGYLTSISAAVPYTFRQLLHLKDTNPQGLCLSVCIVQIFPFAAKEALTDCPACTGLQPEAGFEQYDIVHAMLEVSINRDSFLPTVMRLRWFPTTSGPQFAAAGLERELPSLEEHIIHDARLALHLPQWQPYRAFALVLQIYGPNVAPLTVGKQNLISYVLRQLEKHFYVVNQFFRLAECSHNIELQQATVTLVIVTHSEITDVGLDTVIKSYWQQFQDSLQGAGLNVTRLTITGPQPKRDETVADQIALQLGPPTPWERLRSVMLHATMIITAVLLTAVALHYGAATLRHLSQALNTALTSIGFPGTKQGGGTSHHVVDKYARLLNVDLHTGLLVERADLEISRFPDGSPWVLGSGACGVVYKAVRDGVQEVAVKVLAASPTEAIQLHALKKEICLLRVLSYDPNMVQFYGACLDPGFPMLVLEYMEGGDLQSCIQQDCYPTPQGQFTWYSKGAQIALDVAKGIVFLHEQKVVHNDIKSKNILLTKDAVVAKISDVGTSRILETTATTLSFPMLFTYAYAAPEQLMGLRDACTNKVDMFSFGVVLWEIATQEVPRRGFLRKTRVPSECPQSIEDLISACLSAQPSARPTAKQACRIISSTLKMPAPLGTPHADPFTQLQGADDATSSSGP